MGWLPKFIEEIRLLPNNKFYSLVILIVFILLLVQDIA